MFNEYEVYLLSKLRKEEMFEFANSRKSISSKQDDKSNAKVQVKPIDSTLCCDSACC